MEEEGKRGGERERRKSEPDNHDVPFVEVVLVNKSFTKMAIRMGALEGAREDNRVRTGRKALNRVLGQLRELTTQ
jgi:hypothetical protein